MRLLKFLLYQLYLLQLENYDLGRYWKLSWHKWHHDPLGTNQRQSLVWTQKAGLIFILSCLFSLAASWTVVINIPGIWSVLGLILGFILIANFLAPILLSLAVILLWPFDFAVKQVIISRAQLKIARFKKLKIIGITGSFGKTTMKETLAKVLREKFNVLKTPENINTPIGVARLILNRLDAQTEILIVEMGAYHRGDIQRLCAIAQPDIAILAGINEAHLERFGTMADTIATKFEIAQFSKSNALLVLNQDNRLVSENYAKYASLREVLWFSNSAGIPFGVPSPILGSFASGVLNAASLIAHRLGLTDGQIKAGIVKIKPLPHRLQILDSANGVIVIDDSYNGNPDGVAEAIKVLAGFNDNRKIFITPGLVEMGTRMKPIHIAIGEQLAKGVDLVILIRNSVTPFIAEGLKSKGFPPDKILWFESGPEAHAHLKELLKPGDVILFQNDWPDNYV